MSEINMVDLARSLCMGPPKPVRYTCPTSGDSYGKPGTCPDCGDTLYVEPQAVEPPKQRTEMTLEQADRIFRFPKKPVKCDCVTEYALNGDPDRIVEWADKDCPLCDGDGIQKREHPICADCGDDERCEHGGCLSHNCELNACSECIRRRSLARGADREAAFQRDVAGPLLGLDEERGL